MIKLHAPDRLCWFKMMTMTKQKEKIKQNKHMKHIKHIKKTKKKKRRPRKRIRTNHGPVYLNPLPANKAGGGKVEKGREEK